MNFDIAIVGLVIDPLSTAILTLSRAYDLNVCFFKLSDLRIGEEPVRTDAIYWDGQKMAHTVTEIPPICEARFSVNSHRIASIPELLEKLERLRQITRFTEYDGLGKVAVSRQLLQSPLYDLTIPTFDLKSYAEFRKYAATLKKSILKPSAGRKGLYVSKIDAIGAPCVISRDNSPEDFSSDDWDAYCATLKSKRLGNPILQPRLDFHLDDAHAVDFRLLVSRGASGGWEKVAIYARIGANGTVSNLSRGGYVADPEEILQMIAPGKAAQLLAELEEYCVTIPETIQRFRSTTISCLGIDIGIDRESQKPYILEANTIPGTKYHVWHLAEKKVQYYTYLVAQGAAAPTAD